MITKFQIFESFKTDEPNYQNYFYHATIKEYLPSIVKYGLTPNIDRITNWDGVYGEVSKGKVFATTDIGNAQYYGDIIKKKYSFDWIPILRFKIPKNIKLKPDDNSEFNSCLSLDSPLIDWYSVTPIITDFEIKNGKKWKPLTEQLAIEISNDYWGDVWNKNFNDIDEGLISTFSTKKTIKILKRKFSDYYISILPDGEIEISAGRKEHVSDNIKDIFIICNQLGWYISHGNIDYSSYEFNKNEFFEMSFDDIILKPIFDSTRNIDIKPSILYYITPVKNSNKILKIGLTPKPKINLTDELELAWGMKKELERTTNQECEILKILANNLDIKLYSDIDSRRFGYYTFENIPPKFISILPKEDYRKHWLV